MNTESLIAEKADMFEEDNIEAITRMMQNRKKNLLWLAVTSLMVFCLYWLSNVVLWVPWSHSPQLGIILMLTVNPVFWGVGIYVCLACGIHEVEGRMAHYHILWLCLVSCTGFWGGALIKEKIDG